MHRNSAFIYLLVFGLLQIFGTFYAHGSENLIYSKERASFLITDSSYSISEILPVSFQSYESIRGLVKRDESKAIWIKFHQEFVDDQDLVFDFIRKDFVEVFVYVDEELIGTYQTGYLMPGSKKSMGRWNAVDMRLEAGHKYTFVIKTVNTINEPDLDIVVKKRVGWLNEMLWTLIPNLAFLSVLIIIAAYTLLFYFQSGLKTYFHFSIYLATIFILFAFITDILRDYVLVEKPEWTLFCVGALLLSPYYYFQFMQSFLNTPKLIPTWNYWFKKVVQLNLVILVFLVVHFVFTKDYYFYQDVIRVVSLINVLAGMLIIVMIWKHRNMLVKYFIIGSVLMFVGGLVDIVIWRSDYHLGDIARFGFLAEIIFFSLGLGKKTQMIEEEKKTAQDELVNQLKINESLIEEQKNKLESQVSARTKELISAKEEAEKNAQVKAEFLSVMSHEIRTPMNAIVGLTHMLTGKNIDEESKENLKTLKYSVDNLMLLINNILDYNKISSGHVTLEEIDFDLRKIVDSVSHLFKAKADSKGLKFILKMDEIPFGVNGDPFRLSQVVNNFLSNAIKFTEKGSINLSIKVQNETDELITLRFEISDTGVGIAEDKHDSIFQSFTQASSDTTRKFGGTGLGLSISKELVVMMGGEINLESQLGKGSSFSFDVEFKKLDYEVKDGLSSADTKYLNTEDLNHLDVLIVDDNELNRMVLKKFLNKWNIDCVMASSGAEAIEKLKEQSFDIMLLDLQMPEMDGYEVTEIVRGNPKLKKLPIIAISADTISNVYDKVIEFGIDDFVTKPFNPDELKSKIYNHTSKIKA